jgi:hypothetical protein
MSSTEDTTSLAVRSKDGVRFGKELREKDFMFDKDYLNLNHGELLNLPLFTLTVTRLNSKYYRLHSNMM